MNRILYIFYTGKNIENTPDVEFSYTRIQGKAIARF